jgi:hypothetical protein
MVAIFVICTIVFFLLLDSGRTLLIKYRNRKKGIIL